MPGNFLPKFNQTNTSDYDLNQVQLSLVRTLNPVFNTPILGGDYLSSVSLTTGLNIINHGLERNLNGWIIVRQRAQAQLWDSQDSNKTPTLTLALNSTAPVVVDLYVF